MDFFRPFRNSVVLPKRKFLTSNVRIILFKLCDFGQILVILEIQASLRGTNCVTVKYKFRKIPLTVFREGDDLEDLAETREYLQQK